MTLRSGAPGKIQSSDLSEHSKALRAMDQARAHFFEGRSWSAVQAQRSTALNFAVARPMRSASWFESIATPAPVKTIRRFSMDRLAMLDDFEVGGAW